MMYGFAMANPPQQTVKIGLAMASPYAIPIFMIFCLFNYGQALCAVRNIQ